VSEDFEQIVVVCWQQFAEKHKNKHLQKYTKIIANAPNFNFFEVKCSYLLYWQMVFKLCFQKTVFKLIINFSKKDARLSNDNALISAAQS